MTAEERFWARVDRDGPVHRWLGQCWVWTGALANGYGHLTVDGKNTPSHRFAYELHHGPIPEGMHIDHLCRNRACCNPEHLEPVSPQINKLRARRHIGKRLRHPRIPTSGGMPQDQEVQCSRA